MIINNYIVFEGIDGSGTTTQIKLLAKSLGYEKVFVTAEPTTGETGKFLRRMLSGEFNVDEKTAAFLFAADRCEHIYGKGGIIENSQKGKIVLSDRYFFSSLAYQSVVCGKDLPRLLNSVFPLPEILFYFKIDPKISIDRVSKRSKKREIYEEIDFQKKTADLYEEVINEYAKMDTGMKIVTLDASGTIEEVQEKIFITVSNLNTNFKI